MESKWEDLNRIEAKPEVQTNIDNFDKVQTQKKKVEGYIAELKDRREKLEYHPSQLDDEYILDQFRTQFKEESLYLQDKEFRDLLKELNIKEEDLQKTEVAP